MLAAAATVVVLLVGIWWGGHPSYLPSAVRNALVSSPNGTTVDQALADIEHDYFRPLSSTMLENDAISGAVAGLRDPYAAYQTPSQFRDFAKPPPASRFGGIGVDVVGAPRGLLVKGVLARTPAARAGIRGGDLIVGGDGESFAGRSSAFAENIIRGAIGTDVTLTIERGARRLRLTMRRVLLTQPPAPLVTGRIVKFHGIKIADIALSTFEVTGIHTEVADNLRRLLRDGAKAIVLDLRDNGGGLVTEAQLVASLFIDGGRIVTTRGRSQPTQTLYATGQALAAKQPMAVLVNGYTASAAEIVTGALQVDHRAVIVGTHTYGKGVYQEVRALPNGGAIDITVGEYFRRTGGTSVPAACDAAPAFSRT